MSSRSGFQWTLIDALRRPHRAWALLPMVVLLIDIALFPYLFHTVKLENIPPRSELIDGAVVTVGRVQGHRLSVSASDVLDEQYHADLAASRVGLVFSHYLGPAGLSSRTSPLGRALVRRLGEAGADLDRLLDRTPGTPVGSVLDFNVAGPDFVPDPLYIVLLPEDDSQSAKQKAVAAGLAEVVSRARRDGLDHLIVPGLATDPRAPGHIKHAQFLDALIAALPIGGLPGTIHLQFYRDAPSDELVTALAATRTYLDAHFAGPFTERLAGAQRRPLLLLTSLSLFVASFLAPLTARNAMIIGLAYVASASGAARTIHVFFSDYSSLLLFAGTLGVQCILAVALTWIIHWNPKDILKPQGQV